MVVLGLAISLAVIQNVLNMFYLGSTLKGFRIKSCMVVTSAINVFLIFYNISLDKPLFLSYLLSYILIFLELRIFTKAKFSQIILSTGIYVINSIMVQLVVVSFMSSYFQLPFANLFGYQDLRLISVLFMFFIGIISMTVIIKLIPINDLKILQNNTQQCITVGITYFLFISGLIVDSLMTTIGGWFVMQSTFVIATVLVFFVIILNTTSAGVRIAKLSHFENRLQSIDEEYKENSITTSKLRNLAFRDNLTGCFTRKYIMDYIDDTIKHNRYPFCITYIDLNKLKFVNDTFGHVEGDTYIKDISQVFFHGLRKTDLVSRIGGDEFVVVLPNTKSDRARYVMERVENNLLHLQENEERMYKMGFSYGVYEADGEEHLTRKEIIEEADKLMYEMKCRTRKDGDVPTCDNNGCLI